MTDFPMKFPAAPQPRLIWVTNAWTQDLLEHRVRFIGGYQGAPQETGQYTVAQLRDMGLIGIYRCEGDPAFRIVEEDKPWPLP